MERSRSTSMAVEELVDRFNAIALAQYDAIWNDQNARYARLYKQMAEIRSELKSRDGDQRRALAPLLKSTNLQVRLMTANTLLALEPDLARKALESVRDHDVIPQSMDAGMMLGALDDGSYIPN